MSYKKDKVSAGYYDDGYRYEGYDYYDDDGGYKKRKSYYYYVEKYFKGETKYDEIFKSTCTNSIENARIVYDSPLLKVKYDHNSDQACTNLLTDEISIGELHIKQIETLLKRECKTKGLVYNDKRGLIDIFKFVYIHELSHVQYTKRLMNGKQLFESIQDFDNDEIDAMIMDLDVKALKYKDYELLCRDIVDTVIFQMMNLIEDIYINQNIITKKYKNQFFENIFDSIMRTNRENEKYMFKYVDLALEELKEKNCNTIEDLCTEIPTQHDFIMFLYDILIKNDFKIKQGDDTLEEILEKIINELLPKKYREQRAATMEERMEKAAHARIRLARHNDDTNLEMLRKEIAKIKQEVTKDYYGRVKR